MSPVTAELVALHGLLLILVEVQNRIGEVTCESSREDLFTIVADIDAVIDDTRARELVQLARAALSIDSAPTAIPAAAAGVHA